MRAIIYARTSGDDAKTTGSLSAQVQACEAYCAHKGYTVVETIQEDEHKYTSGQRMKLSGVQRLIDRAIAGAYDVLVTHKVDRLARGRFKHLTIKNVLARHGVIVEYAALDLEATKEGRFLENILADFAELERETITERMVSGQLRSVRKGNVRQSGFVTFGYVTAYIDGRKTLVIVEKEAKIVRLIYKLYTQDRYTIYRIAKYLEEQRIPKPKSGKPGVWSHGTLYNILTNETYVGRWYYNKASSAGTPDDKRRVENPKEDWLMIDVPAIIDENTFAQAQQRLKRQRSTKRKHFYLLAGFIKCGVCGYSVSGLTKPSGLQYYVCNARHGKGRNRAEGPCDSPYYHASEIEGAVWRWLDSLSDELIDRKLRDYYNELLERHRSSAESIKANEQRIAEIEAQKARLVTAYSAGVLTLDDLALGKSPLDAEIEALQRANAELRALMPEAALYREYAQETKRALRRSKAIKNDLSARRDFYESINLKLKTTRKALDLSCVLGDNTFTIAGCAAP